MKKIKISNEAEKDHKTLANENVRLQLFIIAFMAIALCLGTFYFNVICFGSECENKTPRPLFIINPSKSSTTEGTEVADKIKNGYWYSDGIVFFFKDGVFSIARYGTDGGYNGKLGEFKEDSGAYKFEAVNSGCTENCMTETKAYTLEGTLTYADGTVTVSKLTKTEEGNTEELTEYEMTYQLAGNTREEVETYVNNLNN